jgi:hypothetical protein
VDRNYEKLKKKTIAVAAFPGGTSLAPGFGKIRD